MRIMQTVVERAVKFCSYEYEGEKSKGKCLCNGRDICLYNNSTLYEGEWNRNTEHGKGILMTTDWRCIIYKGDWEHSRMHGQGMYYY